MKPKLKIKNEVALIEEENGIKTFSHQRLVVINLINKGIGPDFSMEQLENAIEEVDMMSEYLIKVEEDITIEDIFLELLK